MGAMEEGWEGIQHGVQDVNDSVIRGVRVLVMCVERVMTFTVRCVGGGWREECVQQVRMGKAPVEVVGSFCHLGSAMRCEGRAEAAVRTRRACVWKNWRELASLLASQNIPLGRKAQVYRACEISASVWGRDLGYDEIA